MSMALIGFELLLLLEAMRRTGRLTAFSLIALYILACQLTFIAAQGGGVIDARLPGQLHAYRSHNDTGVALYAALFLLAYLATLGVGTPPMPAGGLRASARRVSGLLVPALALCWGLALVHALAVNHELFWHNRQYLLLGAPEGLALRNRLTELVASGVPLIGLVVAFGLFLALFSGRSGLALAFLPLVLWFVFFALASASRVAATYAFIPAMLAPLLLGRRGMPVALGFAALALFFLLMALNGRGSQSFGLAALLDHAALALANAPGQVPLLVGNLTQGIFVTTDGLLLEARHHESYKILSFSPFPSLVDGFDRIRRVEEVRLHATVPLSAITEVIAFGPGFWIAAAFVFMLPIRLCLLAARRGQVLLAALASVWVFLLFVQAGAYPLRQVFRQELIVIALLVGGMMLSRSRSSVKRGALA